jgi:hypothetical protein
MHPTRSERETGVGISIETESAEATRAAVLAGLRAFNRAHAEAPDFRPLVLAARGRDGTLVGGLVAETGCR